LHESRYLEHFTPVVGVGLQRRDLSRQGRALMQPPSVVVTDGDSYRMPQARARGGDQANKP
ncbi:MAG: hypothetical protein QOJ44_2362, partial [Acidimicrobiaceae bacterium]|nr:hypothetical protein [Acidimicrobiaceae bacterium]